MQLVCLISELGVAIEFYSTDIVQRHDSVMHALMGLLLRVVMV